MRFEEFKLVRVSSKIRIYIYMSEFLVETGAHWYFSHDCRLIYVLNRNQINGKIKVFFL